MGETGRTSGLDAVDRAAVMAGVLQAAAACAIWRLGPAGRIAVHFGLDGRPNGWADRGGVALMTLALAALMGVCLALMSGMTRRRASEGGARRGLDLARLTLIGVSLAVTTILMLVAFSAAGPGAGLAPVTGRAILAVFALILLLTGAVLGKTPPNPFVGVRTYWSLKSRLAWDKSNRLLGRLMFAIGAVGLLAAPFVRIEPAAVGLGAATLLAAGIAIYESWKVWRSDPEREAI